MIIDRIENANIYSGIAPHIDTALNFIKSNDLSGITHLSLDSGDVNINCMEYTTRPCDQCKKEAHRLYADIHVCVEGIDVLGYSNIHDVTPITEYDPETDKQFFNGRMDYVRLLPGMFAITMPEDVHSAMMMDGEPVPAKKLIIKCKL